MQPKSHTLFHFTKNLNFLQDILINGFWPRYCLEDVRWYTGNNNQLAYPIICFCDIPLSRVDEHVGFYGKYGVGVSRKWAESNRLAPVLYVNENSPQLSSLRNLFYGNKVGNGYYKGADIDVMSIMSHIKPIRGSMVVDGNIIEKEFYQESEWRYAVNGDMDEISVKTWLFEKDYLEKKLLEDENLKTKRYYSLKISPKDIKYIFVKSDADIPQLVNFIQSSMDMYPSSDVKILLSRIISLETIERDL